MEHQIYYWRYLEKKEDILGLPLESIAFLLIVS